MSSCGHRGLVKLGHIDAHPDTGRAWVVETCTECSAVRIAEHEWTDEDSDDFCVVTALPWRREE